MIVKPVKRGEAVAVILLVLGVALGVFVPAVALWFKSDFHPGPVGEFMRWCLWLAVMLNAMLILIAVNANSVPKRVKK